MTAPRLTFDHLLRSEWIKLWSVRSTWWCLIITLAIMAGLGLLIGGASSPGTDETGAVRPVSADVLLGYSTLGTSFAQLVLGVLGCLVITGEYGTGMIRTTMLAAPRRTGAVLAKGVLFTLVTLVLAVIAVSLSALAVVSLTSARGFDIVLDDAQLWRGLAGDAVYLALVAAFATGVGLIIRVSAGAIATVLGILLVLPIVANLFASLTRSEWLGNAALFLPSNAGSELYGYEHDDGAQVGESVFALTWWQGGLVLLGWVALVWVIGIALVKRRDV
ncbi:hypothetical protein QT381_13785 [Galbitalea sp. SE-J8]|uniref:hypothetical protein n=1 Tax=Galbitalea sp. SE-J8 TaxID=3054952 RepID=UPI00259D1BE8|nr:hypothetical protein [Galbitalea sp. SE-J8]MDM4764081.1 hypothetical protein [Galbitalea sp. SE-J8]